MRKIAVYGIILFQIILIGSLIRGIQSSQSSKERLADLEKRKSELIVKNEKLKKDKDFVQSEYYLEKVAREELHLVKPGETVVIVPDNQRISEVADQVVQREQRRMQNWEKWWELLVK